MAACNIEQNCTGLLACGGLQAQGEEFFQVLEFGDLRDDYHRWYVLHPVESQYYLRD